jgi:hypothetical protein
VIELLIYIAIIGLVVWLIISLIPMPQPFKTAVIAVGLLIVLLVVIRAFGIDLHMPARLQ